MNNDPIVKIKMIQRSMRCFIFGLLGFLPMIGVPFALVALMMAGQARVSEKLEWNPAKPYRIWGAVFASLAIILWLLVAAGIALHSAENGGGGFGSDDGD